MGCRAAQPDMVIRAVGLTRTIWVRAKGMATNTGPFLGPPSGLPVRFTVLDIARIVDGRIVEHWGVPDRFEILVRTGRLPVAAASAGASQP
ncbi:ester cyclase [Leifsonia sp. C5G2]|uniref:ester cyclase n=1 Tax=Leifsonia sp. C5G2 TaxID=2735269 RepID=UPI00201C0A1F|nr:ester cyclase [Leifsonia sp. C5G2]